VSTLENLGKEKAEWLCKDSPFHNPEQRLAEVNHMLGKKEKADMEILHLSSFLEVVFKQFIGGEWQDPNFDAC
jgi:hypothetical protein